MVDQVDGTEIKSPFPPEVFSSERWTLFKMAIDACSCRCTVIETGRIRKKENRLSDGFSTLFFASQKEVKRIYSIDIDPETEKICSEILGPLADKVIYLNEDSLSAIRKIYVNCGHHADIIYLDSSDDPDHSMREFLLFMKLGFISDRTVILLDDVATKNKYVYSLLEKYASHKAQLVNTAAYLLTEKSL